MSEHETLTNDLIASLNSACEKLREAGKRGDECECYFIGWCSDAWAVCGVGDGSAAETGNDLRQGARQ